MRIYCDGELIRAHITAVEIRAGDKSVYTIKLDETCGVHHGVDHSMLIGTVALTLTLTLTTVVYYPNPIRNPNTNPPFIRRANGWTH